MTWMAFQRNFFMAQIMKIVPLALLLTAFACPAMAQPIESAPLPAIKPYTLSTETDPMAMDPSSVPPATSINRGTTTQAPPPPGENSIPDSSSAAPPMDITTQQQAAPANNGPAPSAADYPNNNVSGLLPADQGRFENRTFCTMKISFASRGGDIDRKTADKVKSYLDGNPGLLTYLRSNWGKKGEYEYCVTVAEHNNRGKVYADLKKLLPRRGDDESSVTLTGKGFAPVKNYP